MFYEGSRAEDTTLGGGMLRKTSNRTRHVKEATGEESRFSLKYSVMQERQTMRGNNSLGWK